MCKAQIMALHAMDPDRKKATVDSGIRQRVGGMEGKRVCGGVSRMEWKCVIASIPRQLIETQSICGGQKQSIR